MRRTRRIPKVRPCAFYPTYRSNRISTDDFINDEEPQSEPDSRPSKSWGAWEGNSKSLDELDDIDEHVKHIQSRSQSYKARTEVSAYLGSGDDEVDRLARMQTPGDWPLWRFACRVSP